jgi:hypothetical protein
MDFFKAAPEQLAKYVDFLATFGRSPGLALEPLAAPKSGSESNVNPQLLLYTALSVGVAMLLTKIGEAVGMAPDSSAIVRFVGNLDEKMRPLAAATLVVIVAVLWHGLAKTIGWLRARLVKGSPFPGDVGSSINASLAVAAWFLPTFIGVLVLIRIAALHTAVSPLWMLLVGVVPLSLAFPVYFVLAFAAAHRLPVVDAAGLFGVTVVVAFYVADLLQRLL